MAHSESGGELVFLKLLKFYIIFLYHKYCQDFQFLVSNPREQVLKIEVNDCLGFADMVIGTGEVRHRSFYIGCNLYHSLLDTLNINYFSR